MKKNFWLVMSVLVLAFCMTVIGCDLLDALNSGDDETDEALNGTWVNKYFDQYEPEWEREQKLVLNNGVFTQLYDNVEAVKGTYSTSGNNLTSAVTQVTGAFFGSDIAAAIFGLSISQWYTQEQFREPVLETYINGGNSQAQAEENADLLISQIFASNTATYTLSGNTLTTIFVQGETVTTTIYTKVVVDTALNGTWVDSSGFKLVLNNGSLRLITAVDVEMFRGTYSTSGNNFTLTVTQVIGAFGGGASKGFLEALWYTRAQFKASYLVYLGTLEENEDKTQEELEAEAEEFAAGYFGGGTMTYTLNGNTLTIISGPGEDDTSIYTKQQ